ncbi:hypothetical protein BG006_006997 [Podila minutissima]|uniref:Uncharacterized protein n=1 Tax=Podila minutissima TaxID=64525 RepID=A0A9P5SRN2_9FUNG|nr:hypothetical protein BG006_006997 [Podila minutissima]
MEDQFPLPLECLRIILNRLATDKSTRALARLLRTNKYVCHATLPYVYSNPFAFFIPTNPKSTFMALLADYPRLRSLIRTLLTSVPDDQCPGLVKAMYYSSESTTLTASSSEQRHWHIDYLAHLQHFQSQTGTSWSLLVDLFRGLPLPPPLKQYLDEHGLVAEYDARAPMTQWETSEDDEEDGHTGSKLRPSTLGHLDLDIHRELTWTICSRVLAQIKSIVIPLSDIGRYLDAAPQMASLQSVQFKMDTVADIDEWWRFDDRLTADALAKLALVKTQRIADLESAVAFVQLHTALFPGTLTHVSCPSHKANLGATMQVCPDNVFRRLVGAIKVPKQPSELTDKNWREFRADIAGTDLSRVRTVHVSGPDKDDWYEQLKATPFLHRCTALEAYYMASLGPDSFKWAVKKDTGVLPPLESVDIHAAREPLGSEVDDIGLAFGKKLQVLKATGYRLLQDAVVDQDSIPTITIGRGWDVPVLKYLSVHMLSERLVMDPTLLSRCRDLRRLDLRDNLRSYNVHELQRYLPAELPYLTELFLSGTPALAFNPDTLRTSTELINLVLGSHSSVSQSFLEAAVESEGDSPNGPVLLCRPEWTWDWFLPRLVTLDLSIEFALSFQFRMVQGTPCLQTLRLTIFSTTTPTVERVLTESDFTTAPRALPDTSAPPGAFDPYGIPHDEVSAIYHCLKGLQLWMEHPHAFSVPADHPDNADTERPPPSDAEQLQERLHHLSLRHADYLGAFSGRQAAAREVFERHCRGIEAITAASPICKRVYETLLAARVRYYRKKSAQAAAVAVLRSEQPERLIVPSLRTLELNGRWVISDDVLEVMLGQVFSSLEAVDMFRCEGFGMHAWVEATVGMPFLETAALNRVLGADISVALRMACLKAGVSRDIPLFETETRKRLRYKFVDGDYTFAEGAVIEL